MALARGGTQALPSLQRVDLSPEGSDPVLLQDVDGFLGLVHRQDDNGLVAFPEASPPDALTMEGANCTVRLHNLLRDDGDGYQLHESSGRTCLTLP
jgi:hypothetical protein